MPVIRSREEMADLFYMFCNSFVPCSVPGLFLGFYPVVSEMKELSSLWTFWKQCFLNQMEVTLLMILCHLFQTSGRWQNNDPVVYQPWRDDVLFRSDLYSFSSRFGTSDAPVMQSGGFNIRYLIVTQQGAKHCAAVVLAYSGDPNWIKAKCNQRMTVISSVFCTFDRQDKNEVHVTLKPQTEFCSYGFIIKEGTCYNFDFPNLEGAEKSFCHANVTYFQFVFDAISYSTFPLFLMLGTTFVSLIRHYNIYEYVMTQDKQAKTPLSFCIGQSRIVK